MYTHLYPFIQNDISIYVYFQIKISFNKICLIFNLCVYIYIYIYIYMCVFVCVCVSVCDTEWVSVFLCARVCVCVCVRAHVCVWVNLHNICVHWEYGSPHHLKLYIFSDFRKLYHCISLYLSLSALPCHLFCLTSCLQHETPKSSVILEKAL